MKLSDCYARILIDNHITEHDPLFMSKFDPGNYVSIVKKSGFQASMVYACCHNENCYHPAKVGHMYKKLAGVCFIVTVLMANLVYAGAQRGYEIYTIPSWGDIVLSYGPGVDPAMDSPQALENMIKHWQGRGFTGVHLRTDLAQIEPLIHRNPNKNQPQSTLAVAWKYIDSVMERFDVHATAQKLGDAHGFKYWAWHTHLFSDGAPENAGSPGPGRMWPWSYCAKYTYEHPEVTTIDRKGKQYWMVREYGYPGARSAKVAEFVYMAKQFGLRRFVACMRSEGSQVQQSPDNADQFGFNEPVVHDMKTLFGVDILTDPRFDVNNPKFDPCDPMVENWHKLRGTYFTQFMRELRESLKAVDQNIQLAITISGERIGPPMGNWVLDWQTWVDEGLIDMIIAPVGFHASFDYRQDVHKGYMVDILNDKGAIPFSTFKNYIKSSKHPEIELICTSGPPAFYPQPPAGTDGWRLADWYDSYLMAWYQRWNQLKKDVNEFGYVKFLEQNFDTFPVKNIGYSGGWGNKGYCPDLRACPGVWFRLGDGNDAQPVVQADKFHGSSGNAIKLTCTADGSGGLYGQHSVSPDRSHYDNCIDTAMTNGVCTFEYGLYRDSNGSSISVYFDNRDANNKDVGLHIAAKTGLLNYSDGGNWIQSSYSMPVGQWQKLTIKIDLDKHNYSAYAGADNAIQLCKDVNYSPPKKRYIPEPGSAIANIEVPAYRIFDTVLFFPEGSTGNVTYLDDVLIKWTPQFYYTGPAKDVYFADDFESHEARTPIDKVAANVGGGWEIAGRQAKDYFIDNDTSFGEGVKCLDVRGNADVIAKGKTPLSITKNTIITVDLDVFVRSDSYYAEILPTPTLKSKHRTEISLQKDSSGMPVAGIYAGNGTWQYWNGDKYIDSKIRIAYDVWNHVQMALDTAAKSYKIVVQPVGEVPTLMGNARWGNDTKINDTVFFRVHPSEGKDYKKSTPLPDIVSAMQLYGPAPVNFSCYDNILITSGQK